MWQVYMGADENDHGAFMGLNHFGIRPDACRSSKGQKMVSFACLSKELKKSVKIWTDHAPNSIK